MQHEAQAYAQAIASLSMRLIEEQSLINTEGLKPKVPTLVSMQQAAPASTVTTPATSTTATTTKTRDGVVWRLRNQDSITAATPAKPLLETEPVAQEESVEKRVQRAEQELCVSCHRYSAMYGSQECGYCRRKTQNIPTRQQRDIRQAIERRMISAVRETRRMRYENRKLSETMECYKKVMNTKNDVAKQFAQLLDG